MLDKNMPIPRKGDRHKIKEENDYFIIIIFLTAVNLPAWIL